MVFLFLKWMHFFPQLNFKESCKIYEMMKKFSLVIYEALKNDAFLCHILITAILIFDWIWDTFMVLFNLAEKTEKPCWWNTHHLMTLVAMTCFKLKKKIIY